MDDKIKLIYERMQDYLRQVEKIERLCNEDAHISLIRETYTVLKNEIKNEANFWDKVTNYEKANTFLKAFYIPAIMEGSAFGLEARVNGSKEEIQRSMFELEYKLTKYKDHKEWMEYK